MRKIKEALSDRGEPGMGAEDLTLEEEELDEIVEENVNDGLKHDEDFEVPDFDFMAVHGPKLN